MTDTQKVQMLGRPTGAFVGASWVALGMGASVYFVGLYNAHMTLAEKGFYLAVFLLGLFAAISVQKAVRDRAEDVPVTGAYLGVAWGMLLAALTLMAVGLWNADLLPSEKGFYGIGFAMSLFAVVAVQKNVRDLAAFRLSHPEPVTSNEFPRFPAS
ncbi:inner membrane protein YiaA [uncultured Microbacterium sp.]|uniref:inner membrane protein YiaA n=1 Tax=uncultured Microbacterium sp. TaxID=191216 RepID=UPI0025F432FC|nr:inner membrane protein YiaA [uncultured Microbacterium sp.]